MPNLQDILNLAKADGSKFFVMDESGQPKLVIMSVEDYEKLLLGKIKREVDDIEKINREIIAAQLQDVPAPQPQGPVVKTAPVMRDMREEVIDPSFDFEGPKMDLEDL